MKQNTTGYTIKKPMALLMIVAVLLGMLHYDMYASENAHSLEWQDNSQTQSVYESEYFKIIFTLANQWENGYQVTVKIENTSDTAIRNWHLKFDFKENEIENLWNGQIIFHENSKYIIKNVGWNQNIDPGNSVEIGFIGKGLFSGFPTSYEILSGNIENNKEDYTVEYHLDSDWENGFKGSITIRNNTDKALEDWTLEFDFNRTITNIWNAAITSCKSNHYIIQNAGYNSSIPAGQSIAFGFTGQDGTKETKPDNYKLCTYSIHGKTQDKEDKTQESDDKQQETENSTQESDDKQQDKEDNIYCNVRFDLSDTNNTDDQKAPKEQKIKKGERAVEPQEPEKEGFLFVGWYTEKTYLHYFDFENTPVTKDITLYARWFHYEDETDTDRDGLTDSLEELFGTDKNSPDTDSDGLTDYIEIQYLQTDPLKSDTDNNGINDGQEDADGDGLTNLEEIKNGTNPTAEDTDEDELTDYEEIHTYHTNPLQKDTDGDKVSDGAEIKLHTNPLVYQTEFHVTAKSNNQDKQQKVTASVSLTLSGEQAETLSINKITNDTLFPENMPGYIGEAYDFHVDGTFDKAVISFTFSEELQKQENFAPTIYYYNEKEQQLEPLETTIQGSTASAAVTHFSTYILINRTVFEQSFTWIDVWETDKQYENIEIMFVIDDSGSMNGNDMENKRLEVARTLIDKLPANSKIGIVRFAQGTQILTEQLTEDRELAKTYLTTKYFESYGNTYMYDAINEAIYLYESNTENTMKMMIVLSDGVSSRSYQHADIVKRANENRVNIHTIGLGNYTDYFNEYLKPLANNTGGEFYLASNADELKEIYNNIRKKIDIDTDSDGDGISDYYEENMIIFNGIKLNMDKNNPDTDNDGLLDGEEITQLKFQYNQDKTKAIVIGTMKSNPVNPDSDGDGLYDGKAREINGKKIAPKDPDLLKQNGPEGMWENHIKTQSDENNPVPTKYCNETAADIPVDKTIAKPLVKLALKLRTVVKNKELALRCATLIIKQCCSGEEAQKAGAYLLNFIYDEQYIAYHSQPDTWQRSFGYNDFYDEVFRIATSMNKEKFEFTANEERYALWLWKGDYWNLHSGAEIGLYQSPKIQSGVDHYEAVDFELPMTLSLYNYRSKYDIENIFIWSPEINQWWITGFNPKFKNPNPNIMVSVGSIDFTGHEELFEGLKKTINLPEYISQRDYLLFDEDGHTLWILWDKGVKV